MNRWVEGTLARRGAVAAVALLLLAAAVPGLARLEVDNSPASFYLEGTPERARFARFEEAFGSAAAVRLVVSGERLWSAEVLSFVERLEAAARGLGGVEEVASPLAGYRRLRGAPADDPAAFRGALEASPVARDFGFISREGTPEALSLLVTLVPCSIGPCAAERRAVLSGLESLARRAPAGATVEVVGLPVLHLALDAAARDVLLRLLPLLALVTLLILFLTFRELPAVVAPFAFVLYSGALVFGAMGWAGVKLDLVVAVLPPVLFSIALAQAVHLLLRGRDLEANETGAEAAHAAVVATFRDKGKALVWTTLSTVAGFGSLAATPVGPIRTLGLWGALAMLAIGAVAFTFYPALLFWALAHRRAAATARAAAPERELELRLERFGRRIADWASARRRAVLLVYAALAAVAAAGLFRLEVESNALDYFPESAPLRRQFAAAEARGFGLASLEIAGEIADEADPAESFATPRALAALAALTAELGARGDVLSAVSVTTLLDEAAAGSPLARAFAPDELRPRLLPLARADELGSRALRRFLAGHDRAARIALFVPTGGYDTVDPIAAAAEAAARRHAPFAEWRVTGELPLLLATQRRLLDTLAVSLAWALPVLALLFLLLLGSVRGALAALVPNVWPVLAILGAMGWFGVPVDIATVMVASIVAGLVVDDTIHTLAPFRELARRVGRRRAVAERLGKTAPAFVLSSLVLASGFAVCVLSDFLPVARFGLLSVVAIAIALAADLFLVPALFGGDES